MGSRSRSWGKKEKDSRLKALRKHGEVIQLGKAPAGVGEELE